MDEKDTKVQKNSKRWIIQFLFQLLITTGIGLFGFDGLINAYIYVVMDLFHEFHKYPLLHLFTITCGLICLYYFLTFIFLWFVNLFLSDKKLIGMLISSIFVIPGCVLGFLAYIVTYILGLCVKGLLYRNGLMH